MRSRTIFDKVFKSLILTVNTMVELLKNAILPYSDKLYLNNVVVVNSKESFRETGIGICI